ncbi:MAG: LamG domain-containing protein, partial [Kiritimatiellae bacterium]|nr:LamG domain-containing protein [Kiritimatiellia bacterium]
ERVTPQIDIPSVSDSGTLAFQNERVATIAESAPNYDLEFNRADVNYSPVTVLSLAFEDEDDPFKDTAGFGSRLVSVGNPVVVNDATRGKVLSLDGESYFKGPDTDAGLAEFNPGSGFTISFWFKPDSDCDKDARMFMFGEPANNKAVSMRLISSATATGIGSNININYGIWGDNRLRPEAYVWDGNWHHFVATHDGKDNPASFSLYFDGQLVGSMTPNLSYAPPNMNFYFGRVYAKGNSWQDGSYPYKGLLDDLLVMNRPLSDQEIQSVYANGLPSAEEGERLTLKNVTASSAGVLSSGESVSVKTLSGAALAGGVELKKTGSSLTVGTGAGATATTFQGTIAGTGASLAKAGADYMLTLDGTAKGVSNVAVNEGTLQLSRPRARQGLVCHYSFDDPADLGHDDGPGGLNLTNVDTGTPAAVDGVRGKAVHFGGTANPVVLGSGAHPLPAAFPSGNDSITVSVWVRPTEAACTGETCVFIWGKGSTGKCSQFRFVNDPSNTVVWNFNGAAYELKATSTANLSDGNWHHIVATYDGVTRVKKIYFDGSQANTMEVPSANEVDIDPTWRLELGRYVQSDAQKNRRYEGDMDEFMVFNYAWTAEEVAAEYNGTATPANVSVAASIPAPVARWTFDGDDPLADTTGNEALHLTAATTNDNYNVTFEAGDAICGKAARFSGKTGSGYLKLDSFPSAIIPSGQSTFTAIARYRPDTTQVKNGALCVVGWGTVDNMANGSLFRIGPFEHNNESARFVVKNSGVSASGTFCSSLGNDRTRWYTVAVVYQPLFNGTSGVYNFYVDGAFVKSGGAANYNITAQDFAIGAAYNGGKAFTGLVDDIQIYDCALSDGQIRMIAEQLEASKGKTTTGSEIPTGVFADQPDVTVAQGATLKVASVETVGNLSGAGSVEIAPLGRLNVSSTDGFSGTVAGTGAIGFADNAELDIGDGSRPLVDIDSSFALGANVNVTTTARAGKILIASVKDFTGVENLETWTATLPGNRRYRFAVMDDGNLYMILDFGLRLIVR